MAMGMMELVIVLLLGGLCSGGAVALIVLAILSFTRKNDAQAKLDAALRENSELREEIERLKASSREPEA